MVTVTLSSQTRATATRTRLSRTALEHLSDLTGTPLPWPPAPPGRLEESPAGPTAELRRLHLLVGDTPPARVVAQLSDFARPEVLVDVDVAVRRHDAGAPAHLRSWHRLRAGRVTTLSSAGGRLVELGACDVGDWPAELTRTITPPPPDTATTPPLPDLVLPHELLLGSAAALRRHRPDVLDDLVSLHPGLIRRAPGSTPLSHAETIRQLRLVHAVTGRMQTVVSGAGSRGTHKAGWVCWLLHGDGWRALTPLAHDGVATIRLHRVEPHHLAAVVAGLVSAVRS